MPATKEELYEKDRLEKTAAYNMLISVGCTEHEATKYTNALKWRLKMSGWHLGQEISRETILDHLERGLYGRPSIKQVEADPAMRQMVQRQSREPPPVANEGGGGMVWNPDRGGK